MILLDTHVLLWLDAGDPQLGAAARKAIDRALANDQLAVSAISFWESAMLQKRKRIRLHQPLSAWRAVLLESGLVEIAIDGEVGILAASLPDFHADPADRLIAATAAMHRATLCTADERILGWSGDLLRRDARGS